MLLAFTHGLCFVVPRPGETHKNSKELRDILWSSLYNIVQDLTFDLQVDNVNMFYINTLVKNICHTFYTFMSAPKTG